MEREKPIKVKGWLFGKELNVIWNTLYVINVILLTIDLYENTQRIYGMHRDS